MRGAQGFEYRSPTAGRINAYADYMTTPNLIRSVATLAFSLAVAGPTAAQHQHPAAAPGQPAHGAQTAPYDLQFIDMMLHHHQDGLRMTDIEERDGARADVKAFARQTADGQKKDREELKAIRDRLYKEHEMAMTARVGGMTMDAMMKKGQQSIAKLEKAGARTDEVFLQTMAMHHQDALKMSTEGMKRLQDGQLRQLAAKTNAMQTRESSEIKQLRSMRK